MGRFASRGAGLRRALLIGLVGACLSLVTGVSAATSTTQVWGSGVGAVLPANAATGKQQRVSLGSLSCASVGNCSAVGSYVDSSGQSQGLLMTERAGTWARGVEAALPVNASAKPRVSLDAVSCASAGSCGAIGSYSNSKGNAPGLLLTESGGRWARGVEAKLPANALGIGELVDAISCPSAGSCIAVGRYLDRSKCRTAGGSCRNMEGWLLREKAGHWGSGVEAKLPKNATSAKQQLARLESVSCAAPGRCSAVGGYLDKSGNSQALLLDEKAGRWARGVEAKLPANAAQTHKYAGYPVLLLGVSCASAGHCSAVGSYCALGRCNWSGGSGGAGEQGLLLTETKGHWTRGVEAKLPANAAGTGPLNDLNSISCASAGNCSAVGSYLESGLTTNLVLLTETAGRWESGVEAKLPADANPAQEELGVGSVSCSSAGNCTAGGSYSGVGQDNTRPLLLTETAGMWATGVGVALPANASTPYQYSGVTVSCARAQNCSAAGSYTDSSNAGQGLLLPNATPPP